MGLIVWLKSKISETRKTREIGRLVLQLDDENSDTRESAAGALGDTGDPRAINPLIAALKDEILPVQWAAKQALIKIGKETVVSLVAALEDEAPSVRGIAAETLGEINDPRAVKPLTIALKDEISPVQWAAKRALVKIGEPAVEALIETLKERDPFVRRSSAEALGEIKDFRAVGPLLEIMKDANPNVRMTAKWALINIGEPVVEALLKALRGKDPSGRKIAASGLGLIKDSRIIKSLIVAMQDDDPGVRETVIGALGDLKEHGAVKHLIIALNDKVLSVRESSKQALLKIGEQSISPLAQALREESSDVRKATAEVLGEFNDPGSVENLIEALKDENPEVQMASKRALLKLGEYAVEPLIRAMGRGDSAIRKNVSEVLGEINDPRAINPLIELLEDENHEVQMASRWSLIKMGGQAVEPLIRAVRRGGSTIRRNASEALGEIKDSRAVGSCIAALKDRDSEVRLAAKIALEKFKDFAVKPLIAAMKDGDSHVQLAAKWILVNIGDSAIDALIDAMKSDDSFNRRNAAEVLGEVRDPHSISSLVIAYCFCG